MDSPTLGKQGKREGVGGERMDEGGGKATGRTERERERERGRTEGGGGGLRTRGDS